jgi:Tol biopolymer transport system component
VVNSAGQELGPELHRERLYFNSARRSGVGGLDIYVAGPASGGFSPPSLLPAPLNSAASEGDFTLSPDGQLALFWSDRSGGLGEGDIYVARAELTGWSAPMNLGAPVNSTAFDFTPSFSRDGRWLYFASMRQREAGGGKSDIYRIRVDAVPALRQALGR